MHWCCKHKYPSNPDGKIWVCVFCGSKLKQGIKCKENFELQHIISFNFSFFTGFGDRLLSEVKKLAPKDIKIRVCMLSIIFLALNFLKLHVTTARAGWWDITCLTFLSVWLKVIRVLFHLFIFLSVFRFQLLQKGFTQHGLGKFASHLFEYLSWSFFSVCCGTCLVMKTLHLKILSFPFLFVILGALF